MSSRQMLKEFIDVISCDKCRQENITSILNDDDMNIPQPGFIGKNFWQKRILFIDRNPGPPPVKNGLYSSREVNYMKCLRDIGKRKETDTSHGSIRNVFQNYFTKHHIYKEVFQRTNLTLDDVAIFNVVRCRSFENRQPPKKAFRNCIEMHFGKWIKMLSPTLIVSFGKAPYDQIQSETKRYKIQTKFINRERSLNKAQRQSEIDNVVIFIQQALNENPNIEIQLPEEIVDENNMLSEGAKKQITINAYERNPEARRKCLEFYGTSCKICNFNFEIKYGTLAKNFIHVHHIVPLSETNNEYTVNPQKDLIPVCPNCHAVIHLKKPALTLAEMKNILEKGEQVS